MDRLTTRATEAYFETLGLLNLGYIDSEIGKIRGISRAASSRLIKENEELYEIAKSNRAERRLKKESTLNPNNTKYNRRKDLISQGFTLNEIALQEEINIQGLRNYIFRHSELKDLISKDYIYARRIELAKCMTAAEIADKEGLNPSTINAYLRSRGIEALDGNKQKRDERLFRRKEMIKRGIPLEEIAQRENIKLTFLREYVSQKIPGCNLVRKTGESYGN